MTEIEFLIFLKRMALDEDVGDGFEGMDYISELFFSFVGEGNIIATSVDKWKETLKEKRMKGIRLVVPVDNNTDYNVAGFANGVQKGLFCEYEECNTLWQSCWEFDNEIKKWNIRIIEKEVDWHKDAYKYVDNLDEFLVVLTEIEKLAVRLEEVGFANCFRRAIDILNGDGLTKKKKYLSAARSANVFGGMGSWNDSPAGLAYSRGLGDEYKELTGNLYKHIQIALVLSS